GDIGNGGQIVVTAPVAKWLEAQAELNTSWSQEHPFVVKDMGKSRRVIAKELMVLTAGVYRITDLKIDLGIADVMPLSLRERSAHFGSIANLHSRMSYEPTESMRYGLVRSPREVAIFV
ncbi:hypothetical protein ACHHYP_06796, partial [Achlya hypogyna]